jgi:DNA-binding NarL/FixJ family response regulator
MARVLIVDDHAAFRQPLAYMLADEPDIDVCGQLGTVADARRHSEPFDVAIVDLGLPDGGGSDVIRSLRALHPRAAFLVLTGTDDDRAIAEAIEAGAAGILSKFEAIDAIIAAVRRLAAGEWLLTPLDIIQRLQSLGADRQRERESRAALAALTRREREVLTALADGLSDKEIAQRLGIRPETARNHMVSIYGKLGVESRLQALVFAIRHGAISIR